jgi:hypothetical protein
MDSLMSEQSYRDHVITGLAELKTTTVGINSRLDKINGSIAHQYELHAKAQKELLEHERDCPLKEAFIRLENTLNTGGYPGSVDIKKELHEVNLKLIEKIATTTENRRITRIVEGWIKPLVFAFIIALLTLLASHFQQAMKNLP